MGVFFFVSKAAAIQKADPGSNCKAFSPTVSERIWDMDVTTDALGIVMFLKVICV